MKSRAGFTVVELLVVIVVIAILAAVSIVAYSGIQQRARDSERKSDFSLVQKALELYKSNEGGYPACSGGTYQAGAAAQTCGLPDADITAALVPKYISSFPADPINSGLNTYLYANGYKLGANGCAVDGYLTNNYVMGVKLEGSPAICTTTGWWARNDLGLIVSSKN
ncbi:MAG TPA: prepilin-type N-terminal cleavage/methylation domain-containing protein [Candidatus Saccharimonadales bacterium]